jgi:hypothetical protein
LVGWFCLLLNFYGDDISFLSDLAFFVDLPSPDFPLLRPFLVDFGFVVVSSIKFFFDLDLLLFLGVPVVSSTKLFLDFGSLLFFGELVSSPTKFFFDFDLPFFFGVLVSSTKCFLDFRDGVFAAACSTKLFFD